MSPRVTCQEFVEFVDRYLSGTMEPDLAARFEHHLSTCPPCVVYMDTYRATAEVGRRALRSDESLPGDVPEDLVQAILRARGGGGQ